MLKFDFCYLTFDFWSSIQLIAKLKADKNIMFSNNSHDFNFQSFVVIQLASSVVYYYEPSFFLT